MTHEGLGLDGTPELAAKLRALKNVACPHEQPAATYCSGCGSAYDEAKAWRDGVEARIRAVEGSVADMGDQVSNQIGSIAAEMRRSFRDMASDFAKMAAGSASGDWSYKQMMSR